MNFRSKRGFTLVEILLVVVIIGILAGLIVPNFVGRSEDARKQAALADIEGGLSSALDLYEMDNGVYPEKLEYLASDPGSARNWNGPYVKKSIPKDPWGNPYVYQYPGIHNTRFYDLSSSGPDAQSGSDDDITNWETTA